MNIMIPKTYMDSSNKVDSFKFYERRCIGRKEPGSKFERYMIDYMEVRNSGWFFDFLVIIGDLIDYFEP